MAALHKTGANKNCTVFILTDLRPESILTGSLDLQSLQDLRKSVGNATIVYLPSLHAKMYVADSIEAVITSANLTEAGLSRNFEYGIILRQKAMVCQVIQDLENYATLGSIVEDHDLEQLISVTNDLKELHQKANKSLKKKFGKDLKDRLEASNVVLLKTRARGKTTHGIFSDTIRYLLARRPLKTTQLHPLIVAIHPDLCDDSVDRIIDGVHFGKKWKHHVRNAQQSLKRQGIIHFDGKKWALVS